MKSFISSFRNFDSFLKWQLVTGFVNVMTWSLCIPIMHKLQGMNWSTAYISVYMICMQASGLIFPLFKGMKLKNLYRINIMLNAVYALSLFICFYDVHIFLIVETILCIIANIFWPLLGIGWDVYVVDKYEKKTFEDFRYWESFRSSVGGVIGSIIVGVTSGLYDLNTSIRLFMIGMVIMIVVQLSNWYKFYREMV